MGPKAKITKMSNNSLGTLAERIIQNIDASTVVEVKTADFYNLAVAVYERYKTATTKSEKKKDDIIDLEFQNRKVIFLEFRKYLQGLQISPDDDVKTSANNIFAEINRFGRNFVNNKNADQSHIYSQIISGLKKSELTADVENLKLNAKVLQFETAHRNYEAEYMQWGNFRKSAQTATNLRKDVESALKNLIEELDWLLRKDPSEAFKNLHTSIYARIDEINLTNTKNKTDDAAASADSDEKAA